MKKFILSTAIVLTLFGTALADNPESINRNAAASFKKDFNTASDVSWSETSHYYRATFHLDKQTFLAYYDAQGNLISVVHHMLSTGLPEQLRKDIRKQYANYWVSELFQVSFDEGSYYFIELKNADETIVLTTDSNLCWHEYSRQKNN